jgi:ABC-type multidrug transport system permease subunit
MTWRNLLTYVRLPQLLVFSTIQPIMLVLLFRYVFGNSINLSDPSVDYVDYLMPGVFVQATVFGALGTGVGLAEDLNKAWWSGSGRCRWHGRRCSAAARSPTPRATRSSWCS